jgi:acyl-CoA thioesterase II
MAGALAVHQVGELSFRASAPRAARQQRRLFGGQVMAQALLAAGRTVAPALNPNLLHARFFRMGNAVQDVDYRIDAFADHGAFAHRRVTAFQGGTQILDLTASFHRAEEGPEHQFPPSAPGDPEQLPTFRDLAVADEDTHQWWARLSPWLPVEVRAPRVPGRWIPAPGDEFVPRQDVWFKSNGELGDEPLVHAGAAVYTSDLFLLTAAMVRHGLRHDDAGVLAVTLNHTVWFHRPFRADEWWRYEQEGSWSGAARLLCRGQMFNRTGRLVATTMQEGLLRVNEESLRIGEQRLAG